MAFGTRGVLAIIALGLLVGGVVATWRGREQVGIWSIAVAFVFASLWAILGFIWSQNNPSAVPPDQYIALSSMAVVATIYYGFKAINATGLTDRM